ncbi:hypothetical protein OIDMADRAFT_112109 [Oidiodendron maius Zn]|uniref:Glutathione S-transferase kappa 1 n=1 Tax=Oidiodendron maius (strain Zn) TaxID=913774 RepID=A0A0C3HCC8_OIDMZ|nr:hypothetical protein OIDMADRAFT_112109 [Oidiodendron maius Zn]
MGGHIDCYMDCSSFYSVIATRYILQNREALASHDVTVDFIPVFLGGINVGSGNKPPWTLPAKANYGQFDIERAKKYHGVENINPAPFFPPLTLRPQRALCYIKATYPQAVFEQAWQELMKLLWTPPWANITISEVLHTELTNLNLFSVKEVDEIVAAAESKEWKDKLLANTQKALDLGAFGAPWFWVRNTEGKEEPFFGSDRFHFMWEFLGLPWQDIKLLPKGPKTRANL